MSAIALHSRLHRPFRSHWGWGLLRLALLVSFLAVKGLAPAGYMLGDMSQPWRYVLCHGDAASVQAFRLVDQKQSPSHALDHRHPDQKPHAHAVEESYCAFAALAGATLVPHQDAPDLDIAPAGQAPGLLTQHAFAHAVYLRPLPRAPPTASA